MNHDSFKELESLFHELCELSLAERLLRLDDLDQSDVHKAKKLRSMFALITQAPGFLDASVVESQVAAPIEVMLDGTTVLASRYTIVECIGVGGSSTVFKAKATNPDRNVAIKMLRFGLSSARARDRFDEESRALASLTHPHIAHVYETGVYQSDEVIVPWIAMELVHGSRTIMEYVASENLSGDQRVELFCRVCDAIRAAHENKVLHLDLNASNILIDNHGYPKIIDFGLTGLIHSAQPKSTSYVGTRTSMAPEQTLFGTTPFDERTDIYSLGLVFIELMTGHQLQEFLGQSDEQSRRLIAIGKARELLSELTDIPDRVRLVADRMIRVDPNDRFEQVGDVIEKLNENDDSNQSKLPVKLIAGLCISFVCVVAWALLIDSSPLIPPIAQHTDEGDGLVLPAEIAVDISSQNPRDGRYSPSHARMISGISMALESSAQMDPLHAAELHSSLADNYRIAGGYEEAIKHYGESITLLEEHGKTADVNWTLLSLTDLLLFLDRVDHAQRTLALIDRDKTMEALFLINLGIAESQVHIALGEHDRALSQVRYTRTLLLDVSASQHQERIDGMIRLSDLFEQIGEPSESVALLYEARKFADDVFTGSSKGGAFVEVAIANALFGAHDESSFTPAIEGIERAISVFEKEGDLFHAMWGARQLGHIFWAINDYERAFELYSHAHTNLRLLLGEGHHETMLCLGYTQLAEAAIGNQPAAHLANLNLTLESLEKLLGTDHSSVGPLRANRNHLLTKLMVDD